MIGGAGSPPAGGRPALFLLIIRNRWPGQNQARFLQGRELVMAPRPIRDPARQFRDIDIGAARSADTPKTCDPLRHIQQRIFGELYAWAGRWRNVTISK